MTYYKTDKVLRLDCIGEDMTENEIKLVEDYMDEIGIGDAELVVINDLEQTIMDYVGSNIRSGAPKIHIVE